MYDILTAIIVMCSRRILCRLRFVPNVRKKSKQPIKEVLQEAISSLKRPGNQKLGNLSRTATVFMERAKEMIKLADSWTKHQTLAQLRDLIEGVYRLRKIGELKALLDAIPNRDMAPSSRRNLFNIVSKVARYREAAQFLYHTAKDFRVVRQMNVVIADLPEKAFHNVPIDKHTPRLASAIMRISAAHRQREFSHICRLLNTTELQANDRFVDQTRKTMTRAKIHAEVQLLFYCELNASEPPPRVICSSKDACFLCNAFILMHGKMHTPRNHGRLYPGWRLPLFPKLNDIEQRFNFVLENQVRNSLMTLLSRQRKTVYPDPNESTLLTLPKSASTIHSSVLSDVIRKEEEAVQAQPTDGTGTKNNPSRASSIQTLPVMSGNILSASSATETGAATIGVKEDLNNLPLDNSASRSVRSDAHSPPDFLSKSTANDTGDLIQGMMLSRNIAVGNKSPLYAGGSLEAQIEYPMEAGLTLSDGASKELCYDIEWVAVEEATRLKERQAASIIDAEALQGETPHELDDQNCLFLAARGVIIKIILRPRPA
jgi:hypothetical protein